MHGRCAGPAAGMSATWPGLRRSVLCCVPTRRQDRKLKEGFARLQQENEALRRQVAMLQKGGGGGMQLGAPHALGLGPGGSGRVSRMNVLGAEEGLMMRPSTALAPRWGVAQRWGAMVSAVECQASHRTPTARTAAGLAPAVPYQSQLSGFRFPPAMAGPSPSRAVHPDPSPISSMLGGGGGLGSGGTFGFDTPENPPLGVRQMHASGGSGGRLQLAGALGPPAGMGARDSRRAAMGFNAREWLSGRGLVSGAARWCPSQWSAVLCWLHMLHCTAPRMRLRLPQPLAAFLLRSQQPGHDGLNLIGSWRWSVRTKHHSGGGGFRAAGKRCQGRSREASKAAELTSHKQLRTAAVADSFLMHSVTCTMYLCVKCIHAGVVQLWLAASWSGGSAICTCR